MIFKFGMQHGGLGIYKICINGDLGLTLTYFTSRSFPNLGFSKVKTMDFSETIAACDPKGGIRRQLIELINVCEYW